MKITKKTTYTDLVEDRIINLMSEFAVYETKARKLAGAGAKFKEVVVWQEKAANIAHEIDDEGLLYKVYELYSWEKENVHKYLEIYKEFQSGVKI